MDEKPDAVHTGGHVLCGPGGLLVFGAQLGETVRAPFPSTLLRAAEH